MEKGLVVFRLFFVTLFQVRLGFIRYWVVPQVWSPLGKELIPLHYFQFMFKMRGGGNSCSIDGKHPNITLHEIFTIE